MNIRIKHILLAFSGVIPVAVLFSDPPDVMLLIYSVFIAAYFIGVYLVRYARHLYSRRFVWLFALFLLSGLFTEIFAWLSDYLANNPEPATFHPQLGPDIILASGFYAGQAVAWCVALYWFRFSLVNVFIVSGVYGVFIEQGGAVLQTMLQVMHENILAAGILGVYVFVVYGAIAGVAYAPLASAFNLSGNSNNPLKYLLIAILILLLPNLGFLLVSQITELLGGLPEARSALEHPLW